MNPVYQKTESTQDNLLLAGQGRIVTDTVRIAPSQSLDRGSVLGLKADTKEAYLVDKTKTDGTEQPYAILAESVTTDETAAEAVVYLSGEFYDGALLVGSGEVADYKEEMRKIGMFVSEAQNRGI